MCSTYSITASDLVGVPSTCGTTGRYCNSNCTIGFSWQDKSAKPCDGYIYAQVRIGLNCNSGDGALPYLATPNGPLQLPGGVLPFGPENCQCNTHRSLETNSNNVPWLAGPSYNRKGLNTLTFSAPNAWGFTADASGVYARLIISNSS